MATEFQALVLSVTFAPLSAILHPPSSMAQVSDCESEQMEWPTEEKACRGRAAGTTCTLISTKSLFHTSPAYRSACEHGQISN